MTVTLTFQPEVEAGLLAKARERGMGLQDYLQAIVEHDVLGQPGNTPLSETTRRQEAVCRMLEFGDSYRLSLGEPVARSLLHEGHRF